MAILPFKKKSAAPKGGDGGTLKPMTHIDFNELANKAKKARRPVERDWYLNLAFLNGEHYVTYSMTTNRLVALEDNDASVRTMRNVMFKIARTERAKLAKIPLQAIALPLSDEQNDLMQAKIGTAYFKWLDHQWIMPRRLRTARYWVVGTGNVFIKAYWADKMGQMAVVSPFDLLPDPYARSMLDCRWMIHQQFMEVDQAKELFADVKGANLDVIRETTFDSFNPVESAIFMSFHDGFDTLPGALLKEYWQPPTAADKLGRHTVFTDTGIVLDEPFPFNHGRMPFVHMGHVERANSKWYSSVLDPIRPMQMELNRTESQLVENRNLANGKWYIPPGLELDEDPNAEPRQVMRGSGDPNLMPTFIQINPLPAEVWGEPDRIQHAMEDLAGQHEVSNGGVPGRVEAAQAIQLVQETEDAVMKDTISSGEEAVASLFWMQLALFKQFGEPEQMIEVYDKAGGVEVMQMKRDELKLDMRVVCQTTTALPASTAGKWDRVLNLFQYKIIDAPTALKLLDLTPEDPDLDPVERDRKAAWRENLQMIAGAFDVSGQPIKGIVRANKFDNHGAHREEHDKFRKGAEYKSAVAADPRVAQLFDFHDEEHKELDIQVAVEQAQKQAAVNAALQTPPGAPPPGAPPGPPGPPPAGPPAPPGAPPMPPTHP